MDITNLVPTPDSIPAPAWTLILLEQLTFLVHIIVANALLGGAVLILYQRLTGRDSNNTSSITEPVSARLPVLLALAINFGVAPLLFLQVVYGNLFYTSSVLMAVYWIMIIPVVILAYYAAHFQHRKFQSATLSVTALCLSIVLLLYTAFILICNNSLMERPETWVAYFQNRAGVLLNISWKIFIPRFLHFIFASLAAGGLYFAVVYDFRKIQGKKKSERYIRRHLRIFAAASMAQAAAGVWYLMAIPEKFMLNFMGCDILSSAVLMTGIISGMGAIITAFSGRLKMTLTLLGITLISMITTRYRLRMMYLEDHFRLSDLQVSPQYNVFILFLLVLALGLAAIIYMLRVGVFSPEHRHKS